MSSDPEPSEAEFLRLEAEKAKAAVSRSLLNAKAALVHTVDPIAATRRHPLIAIGSAAVAGFVATVIAIPSKQERELRHLERLRRAMNPEPPPPAAQSNSSGNGSHAASKPPAWAMILKETMAFLKPILLAQITSKVRAEAVPPQSGDSQPVEKTEGPDKSS